jgi:3-phosphoshikimate 1-carboxyvinyltransferase
MGGVTSVYLSLPGDLLSDISIVLPRSKSISNRLLVMQKLSRGSIDVDHISDADDTRLLRDALQISDDDLWLGHAGTALRFGLAWAAITPGTRVLRGSDRLSERPIGSLVDALRQLGAEITYLEREGHIPVRVAGRTLNHAHLEVASDVSSQFTSALMLIGPYINGGVAISRKGAIVSQPYLEMTAALMLEAGAEVELSDVHIRIEEGTYADAHFDVEADWSAASYFYALLALAGHGDIELVGLQRNGLQGDAVLAEIFSHFGIRTEYTSRGVRIHATGILDELDTWDFVDCPDLAQTVAVVAAGLSRPFRLTGLQTLRYKETDRIHALAAELGKCGVHCETGPDFLALVGFESPAGIPKIATYDDHRMAMAFAPLSAVFGEIQIEDPDVVSKSFPGFWDEMGKAGVVGMVS